MLQDVKDFLTRLGGDYDSDAGDNESQENIRPAAGFISYLYQFSKSECERARAGHDTEDYLYISIDLTAR